MRLINKFSLLFFFLLVFSSFSLAAQPNQELGTMSIVYPKIDVIKVNEDFKIHLHTFNALGYILPVADYDCYIHIYGPMGNHEVETNMVNNGNMIEKVYTYNASINNEVGWHSYTAWCNSSLESGVISEQFLVTKTGTEINPLFIVIGLLGLAFVFLYFAFGLDNTHTFLKLILLSFSMLFLYLVPKTFIDFSLDSYGLISFNLMQGFIYLFFLYFFLYFTYIALDFLGYSTNVKQYLSSRMRKK